MKYANLVYDYNSYDGYLPREVNLGDYIQSIAAQQYLPRIDEYVDRDGLSEFKPPQTVKLIANGWYFLNKSRHLPVGAVDVLLTSVHINNIDRIDPNGEIVQYLKEYSSIRSVGCRDYTTLKFLRGLGIDSHFSSCLTTTLKRKDFSNGVGTRSGVVFSDFSFREAKLFPINRYIKMTNLRRKLLKNYSSEPMSFVTHGCDFEATHEERFLLARKLLNIYADAKLVVTSRIHAALPCLAMGTPVIYVGPYDELRFEGLSTFFNALFKNGSGIKYDEEGYVVNGDEFKCYADALIKECEEFIES